METVPTTHTDVDRELFDKLPLESQSSSLSSLVTLASPGFRPIPNGLFHGLGDHASNSFSSTASRSPTSKARSSRIRFPIDAVQSMEVIEGAPPAEYGDKTSLVIVVTTRSGWASTSRMAMSTASYGTSAPRTKASISRTAAKGGNFISANGLDTAAFWMGRSSPSCTITATRRMFFDRVDFKPLTQSDTINLNLGFTRSWFQTPNSYDAQNATAWNGLVVG
jgi:hypothetical protein